MNFRGVPLSTCFLPALFGLAFRSRVSLPLLVSAGCMLLDLHLRLDVEIEANIVEQEVEEEEEEVVQVHNNNNPTFLGL